MTRPGDGEGGRGDVQSGPAKPLSLPPQVRIILLIFSRHHCSCLSICSYFGWQACQIFIEMLMIDELQDCQNKQDLS